VIFLVPALLAVIGVWTGRTGLVVIALGLFLWLSWDRKKSDRQRLRLFSVPMPPDGPGEFAQPAPTAIACGCV